MDTQRDIMLTKIELLHEQKKLSIFPVRFGTKEPACPWKPWQTERATRAKIMELFAGDTFNIGLPTGALNRIALVDVDTKELDVVRSITEKYGRPGFCIETARGFQLPYLYDPEKGEVRNRVKIEGQPIDIRGEGGYGIAWGKHPSGAMYKMLGDWRIPVEELPPFPYRLLPQRKESSKRSIEKAGDTDAAWSYVAKITATEGHRDNTAYRVACVLIHEPPDGFALSHTQALPLILRWGAECCSPEFSDPNVLSRKLTEAVRVGGSHRDRIKLVLTGELSMFTGKEVTEATCVVCGQKKEGMHIEFNDGTIKGFLCFRDFQKAVKIRSGKEASEKKEVNHGT